ncbi:MAG: formyltetrahydrofolate deformylase [Thiothrix sp.]|nr:formyltetrahydrofolate deformylase [Thiothrix sp.]HPQ97460.1 formyltetrahydrofolate deformylase [Thiolinea sp.]
MPANDNYPQFVLKASCRATSGVIAAVTAFLAERGCYISELSQFDDQQQGLFFMRTVAQIRAGQHDIASLEAGFPVIAERFGMSFGFHDTQRPMKVLLMVSRFDHCLDDLLYRHRKGELPLEITAVVSNHLDLRPMAEREGIRFIYLPVRPDTKQQQEQALLKVVEETGTELVVLARYMQILSDELCRALQGRAINIHHSFLPGFKGARPYHQAYERGVKLIGATAHYVTADLDEGPIIEQSVQQVDHTYGPEALTAVGRDTETIALARAVQLHVEHRVFLDGNKTVVFR